MFTGSIFNVPKPPPNKVRNGPVGSNHGKLQNTPLLALGYRARGVRYGDRERGGLIREVTGLITEGITVRAGQRGRQAGVMALGARQAREEGRKTWGPVVGYV